MTITLPLGPACTTRFRIDPKLDVVATRAPAVSMKDSCLQAILKLQPAGGVRPGPVVQLHHSILRNA